ncbi:MAG: helicase-related protein, partial [Halanaerobiales bacterium]
MKNEICTQYGITKKEYILKAIPSIDGEVEIIERLLDNIYKWDSGVKDEFSRLEELYNYPERIKGRLNKVIDYLSEANPDGKFVVFTSWVETLEEMEKILVKKFGPETVASFYSGKDNQQLQKAVDKFQNNDKCRIMLCDELGGEGRNFQIAEAVLHIDLPWSPIQLEQRIGRLDRIGRTREVLSIVFCSEDTIEEDLFNLWNQGLNIFNESLSGMEIALGDIQEEISCALQESPRYGLGRILDQILEEANTMKEVIKRERYFDMARQLDRRVGNQLEQLINKFDDDNGARLFKTMMAWTSMAGFKARHINYDDKTV